METGQIVESSISPWITVIVAAIVALSTLGAALLQNLFSHKRFSIELQMAEQRNLEAKQRELRERRREVRSKPLLKLRDELAIMAAKSDIMIHASEKLRKLNNPKEQEQEREKQQNIMDDWSRYIESGKFNQTILIQYDDELVNKSHEVIEHYAKLYNDIMRNEDRVPEKVWPVVIKLQEMINKKLEEL